MLRVARPIEGSQVERFEKVNRWIQAKGAMGDGGASELVWPSPAFMNVFAA